MQSKTRTTMMLVDHLVFVAVRWMILGRHRHLMLFLPVPLFCTLLTSPSLSQSIDISHATVVCLNSENTRLAKVADVLLEEVEKRTGIRWDVARTGQLGELGQSGQMPVLVLGAVNNLSSLPQRFHPDLEDFSTLGPEGYRLHVFKQDAAVVILGHDVRGVLYGAGKLLRKMSMRPGEASVPCDLSIATSPRYPIRGHQLGYRPKTNSYDAWTVAQYDQYIRELALFGANSIEIMPPRTDDDLTSPHMKLPAIEMIGHQSRICDSYGLDVWMWYPNLGGEKQYTDPALVKEELEERRTVFQSVPRLDALFVPGGDPGELEPDVLFAWLEKVAVILHQYHPDAKIWISPQVFRPRQAWFDAFYAHVNSHKRWFGGVVFGPWVKTPLPEIRRIVDADIPIRRYPDITHSLSCQYPIPKWDLAYATTLGRECINPRPEDEKTIHNALDEYAEGSISYSEGTNDDVNKFIWSDQDWNPNTPVIETLRDYARLFFGPDHVEPAAQGLLALEDNLRGPLMVNDSVSRTLRQWQRMEARVSDRVLHNFRFQMGLIRAYYDAYVQRRLIYEAQLEQKAREILDSAGTLGSRQALLQSRQVLELAWKDPVAAPLRQRCLDLADDLFDSIGAQLTVEKHGAMDGRGNFIDNIDLPLNEAPWLRAQFEQVPQQAEESERLQQIASILHRQDPGPAGFYDNGGSPRSWLRVVSDKNWAEDPGSLESPRVSFGVGLRDQEWVHVVTAQGFDGQAVPRAWMNGITCLYDHPLMMIYQPLDPLANYTLRISYTGRLRSRMKLVADNQYLIHDFVQTGVQPIYEFALPHEATSDGAVQLKWTCGESERGSQVSEIWLMHETQ